MNEMKKMQGIGALGLLLCAHCSSGPGAPEGVGTTQVGTQPSPGANATSTEGDELPSAVASIQLSGGGSVDFYDLKIGALVVGRGNADTSASAVLDAKKIVAAHHGADHLTDAFAALNSGLPVPAELTALQDRLTHDPSGKLAPSERAIPIAAGEHAGPQIEDDGVLGAVGGALLPAATPVGCSNGCCDSDWLHSICTSGYDWSYFEFNRGWSTADTGTPARWSDMLVCSASGTSNWVYGFSDTCGGVQYHWTVAEATFSWQDYNEGTFCYGGHSWSNVNTKAAQHLHTNCGAASYGVF